jgi:hypothetical protein
MTTYFANQDTKVVFSNGQLGTVRWLCVVWKLRVSPTVSKTNFKFICFN